MAIILVCPICKSVLYNDLFSLKRGNKNLACKNCKTDFQNYKGCIDFTTKKSNDKEFYEKRYTNSSACEMTKLDFEMLEKMWFNPALPARKVFFNELDMKNIRNKCVLLLGNGKSLKELYFLKLGAKVIYTDISVNAVADIKNKFDFDAYEDKIVFHAVDAYNIPLSNESIDIMIGYGFVHHLADPDSFIQEAQRVLKQGGECLFRDAAYSSIWQRSKFSFLKPVVNYSHKRWGISPEDNKATNRGGYFKQDIENWRKKYNFSDMTFVRLELLSYIFRRGTAKLFGYNKFIEEVRKIVVPVLFIIDNFIAKRLASFYNLTTNLVWGFKKRASCHTLVVDKD